MNNSLVIDETCISEETNKSMQGSIVYANDVLLNITGGSIGRSCVVPVNFKIGNVNQHVSIIRLEKDSPKFLQSILSSFKGQKLIFRGQTGSGREGLNFQSIRAFKFNFPSLPEQQKIASFLTAVDTKIAQLSQKLSLLEAYKKGAMQGLFRLHHGLEGLKDASDSGQSKSEKSVNPCHLRFTQENGNNYPDWEEKKLGDFTTITTGTSNRQDSGTDGQYTFFDRSVDIRTSEIYLFDTEAIIVAGEGSEFIPKYFIGKFDLHQRTYAIMEFQEAIGKFLYYFIYYYRNYFLSQAVGSTVKSLRLPMFKLMNVSLPCIIEQTKIANFLSALDAKIDLVKNQLENTQAFKKGLLQQMFV